MKKGRIPKVVKDACKEYSIAKKLPLGQFSILLDLATQSYKNMPISERDEWTLEEVLKQGL